MAEAALPVGVTLHPCGNEDELLSVTAAWLSQKLGQTTGSGGGAVALTGGSTARALYLRMASLPDAAKATWPKRHWFWGDERFVPHDSPDSNFGMTKASLFAGEAIPPTHIHAIPTDTATPEASAQAYERTLREFYGADTLIDRRSLFDVVLLSLGPDGHIASLFPGSDAVHDRNRWALPVSGREQQRISLTLPVLESAQTVVLLAAGEAKAQALRRYFDGEALPVTALRPLNGLHLFADAAALGKKTLVKEVR